MAVEILFGQVVKVRGVENRGGVDEEVDWAELFVGLLEEFAGCRDGIREVGLDESDFDSEEFEFGSGLLGFVARRIVMDGNVDPLLCECEGDVFAEADRGTGDEGAGWFHLLRSRVSEMSVEVGENMCLWS